MRIQSDMTSRIEANPPPRYFAGAPRLIARRPEAPPALHGRSGRREPVRTLTNMHLLFALSPLLFIGLGAMLLMLAEAFSSVRGGLALGSTIIFATAGVFAAALWLFGADQLTGVELLQPWLLIDRFHAVLRHASLPGRGACVTSGWRIPARAHARSRRVFTRCSSSQRSEP